MNRPQKRDKFIDNLEKFRVAHGYSGPEFARMLQKKRQQWDRWKNGLKRNGEKKFYGMTLHTIHQLIENLNKATNNDWTLSDWLQDELPGVKK